MNRFRYIKRCQLTVTTPSWTYLHSIRSIQTKTQTKQINSCFTLTSSETGGRDESLFDEEDDDDDDDIESAADFLA